jgi:rhodanese-related sulfurtransferase
MKSILAAAAVVALLVPVRALACGDHDTSTMAHLETPVIQRVDVNKVLELQKMSVVYIYDANSEKTRKENGVVPGATLLASATEYDVKVLPPSKESAVVFYCANAMCRASTFAAERATRAGYSNVSVMAVGIKGWKAAGQKTAAMPRSNT